MQSIRLIQLTDTHLVGDATRTLRGINTLDTFKAALAHASNRFQAADAMLLSGDLVHDDAAGYKHIVDQLGDSKIPVYCIAGNHDVPDHMNSTLSRAPFQIGGTALMDRWAIVLLDSFIANSDSGRIGAAQLQHLDRTLTQHASLHVMVCLHHHPIKMRSDWLDTVGLEDATEFHKVIARHKNVRAITWGHVHQSLDMFSNGVRYMATPAACAQFKPLSSEFAMDDKPPGYRTYELMADGTIATEVVWLDNAQPCKSTAAA
jgi:3',5'-cyclic-AMP phosphodiesterase